MTKKGFKYRIYPTEKQKKLLACSFGCARFIYNEALIARDIYHELHDSYINYHFLATKWLKQQKEIHPWLKDVYSQILQQSLMDQDRGFKNFFKGLTEYPKFHKKTGHESIRFPQNFEVDKRNNKIKLPGKLGEIFCMFNDRKMRGDFKSITISKNPSGQYFASILVETTDVIPPKHPIRPETTIGIDLGINFFATISDGRKIENPRFLQKSLGRLAIHQKRADKKQKKSKNRKKELLKAAKLHQKIVNQRNNFLHEVSTRLIRENQSICLEDLPVAGMMKTNLARSVSDVSSSKFVTMLTYKAEWSGVNIIRINRFDPSSKKCSNCGQIHKDFTRSTKKWFCNYCHAKHGRDINAAKNIKDFGLARAAQPVIVVAAPVVRTKTKGFLKVPLAGKKSAQTTFASGPERPVELAEMSKKRIDESIDSSIRDIESMTQETPTLR